MLRAIKIRLYPNKEQELKLNKVLGCYRFVYNQMLALKQQEYNDNKKSLGLTDLSKYFHGTLMKDEQYSWLKEQNTKVVIQTDSIYNRLGFDFAEILPPDYGYTRGQNDYINKEKIKECHLSNGHYKIYDCGSFNYIWRRNN